jgi:hypothetical protein
MLRALPILWLLLSCAPAETGQSTPAHGEAASQRVDGIAILIENDIVTESEVQELANFQQLLNGKPKSRAEILDEMVDQWIVRHDAESSAFTGPSEAEVSAAAERFTTQFPAEKLAAAGLTPQAVQRLLRQELYLSRFLDFRFRPSAQVTDKDIELYYRDELLPQLQAQKQAAPQLDEVRDEIREVLTLREIGGRADQWLSDTRSRLHLEMNAGSGGS